MRFRFNPARFIGHLLFASLGGGAGTALTFVVAWLLSGNAGSSTAGVITTSLLVGLVVLLPLIIPCAVLLLTMAWLLRMRLPVVEPGGGGMILILGGMGIIVEVLLLMLIGVAGRGAVGQYMLLSAGVGGALCGIIIGWRMKE